MRHQSLLDAYRENTNQLQDLADIAQAETDGHAWEALERLCHNAGFGYSGVGMIGVLGGEMAITLEHASPFFVVSFAKYQERGLHLTDPTAERLASGARVMVANTALKQAPAHLQDGAAKIKDHFLEDGILEHAALRIDMPHSAFASFLGIGVLSGDTKPEFRANLERRLGTLTVAATAYTSVMMRQAGMTDQADILTQREAHVLTLLARGLSPDDIAEQEHRALPTIRQQIKSARQRLNARSSAHAVAIALHLGEIRL
ncbi:MAG: helix-turn-helix transcriptional regulator [Pseudomonadota bacterium]